MDLMRDEKRLAAALKQLDEAEKQFLLFYISERLGTARPGLRPCEQAPLDPLGKDA